jgi:hypothetical protein
MENGIEPYGILSAFYGAGAVRAPCRILTIVSAEDAVEVGDVLLEGKGTVEELLGCHGEELGLVCRAVGSRKVLWPFSERRRSRKNS